MENSYLGYKSTNNLPDLAGNPIILFCDVKSPKQTVIIWAGRYALNAIEIQANEDVER